MVDLKSYLENLEKNKIDSVQSYAIGNKIKITDDVDFEDNRSNETKIEYDGFKSEVDTRYKKAKIDYGGVRVEIDTSHKDLYKRYHFFIGEKEALMLTTPYKQEAPQQFLTLHVYDQEVWKSVITQCIEPKKVSIAIINKSISPSNEDYDNAYNTACRVECPDVKISLFEISLYIKFYLDKFLNK